MQLFVERSYGVQFEVVRCLLCGWQISRVVRYVPARINKPWKELTDDFDGIADEGGWGDGKLQDFVFKLLSSGFAIHG